MENKKIVNIYRDWKIILIASFLLVLLLILWSLYLLEEIKNDELSKVNTAAPLQRSAVNEKKLETVINGFLQKEATHESLKTTPLKVVDPSR